MKNRAFLLTALMLLAGTGCHWEDFKTKVNSGENSVPAAPEPVPGSPSPDPAPPTSTPTVPSPMPEVPTTPTSPSPASPLGDTFEIYNDRGGIMNDPDVQAVVSGPLIGLNEIVGEAPEGTRFWAITAAGPQDEHSVNYGKNPNRSVDLSAFAHGNIRFSLRLRRPLQFARKNKNLNHLIRVIIKDRNLARTEGILIKPKGFDEESLAWQEITAPLPADFPDYSQIVQPFGIFIQRLSPESGLIDFDIDNVRWEK